ncbi:hypothetical protein POF50_011405 [Streptomyces sp. SL13]|uniref:Uncharacterized protein n=1 Tax=Streptantibioticus silvisoli TaxID=2705255 RepID=A0AA90H0M9_9ACTN|nr:hypothetical protein [Streptantibioticus silvisoli]MDI5969936.1 hypothetical protein [Streptantibioticus silvisoli]
MTDDHEMAGGTMPDESLVRRIKALACTAPLQALDSVKSMLDWNATGYHMAEMGLHVIDLVTIAMDFDSGADPGKVIHQAARFAAAQQPGRGEDEYRRVADWVLHKLINVGTVDRGFSWQFGRFDEEHEHYGRFDFDFKLIVERADRGRIRLRTTDEAINVLVGALDTDVESAQVAAEHKLRHLIEHGRLDDAKVAAEQARHRTVQYGESLRRQLEAAQRDVRTVDWEHQMPTLLNAALDHIERRYEMENAILAHITERRDSTAHPRHKQRAAELVLIVRDCISRHMQLQRRIQSAGDVFRSEQDRQQFSEAPSRASIDIFGQLLTPALSLAIGDALPTLTEYFRAANVPDVPDAVWMPSIVSRLFASAPAPAPQGEDVPTPELDVSDDPAAFTAAQRRRADELLSLGGIPEPLSSLLRRARVDGPEVTRLVLHRAGQAFSPPVGDAVRQAAETLLIAVPTGGPLDDSEFGGDELLLAAVPLDPSGGQGPTRADACVDIAEERPARGDTRQESPAT